MDQLEKLMDHKFQRAHPRTLEFMARRLLMPVGLPERTRSPVTLAQVLRLKIADREVYIRHWRKPHEIQCWLDAIMSRSVIGCQTTDGSFTIEELHDGRQLLKLSGINTGVYYLQYVEDEPVLGEFA